MQQQQQQQRQQQQQSDDRAARQEARHLEQLEALVAHQRTPAPLAAPPTKAFAGFKSNPCFKELAPFSGVNRQPLRPWFAAFQDKVAIAGLSEDDALRELRLKLVDGPSALYLQHFADDDTRPTILEVLACLAKDFGIPYEEATLYAAYVQCRRAPHSSGREYLRALTTAQRDMQAAGIPLIQSASEQRYYMCELGLSAPQRQTFLAQLSGRADVSDDYLRGLTPTTVARRRESVLNPPDSEARQECFFRRVGMVEAFLQHDDGTSRPARAAVTSGTPVDDADSARSAPRAPTPPRTPPAELAARVLALQGAWQGRRDLDRRTAPPQYFGPNAHHLTANLAMYDSRVAAQACFGCTPAQMKAAPPGQPHWECTHHGQHASAADRMVRVTGSGSGVLATPPRSQ